MTETKLQRLSSCNENRKYIQNMSKNYNNISQI